MVTIGPSSSLPGSAAGRSPTSCSTARTTAIDSGGREPTWRCMRFPVVAITSAMSCSWMSTWKASVRMLAIVVHVVPGQKVTWQLRKGLRLPVWLTSSWPIAAAGSTCGTRSRPGSVASGGSSTRCSGASPPSSPPRWTSTPGPNSRSCGSPRRAPPPFLITDHTG